MSCWLGQHLSCFQKDSGLVSLARMTDKEKMITIDDFAKVEIKIGMVIQAADIPGSDKLLRLMVDLGEDLPRQILSGIKQWYKPKSLTGKQFVFITNLEPKIMMGLESQGMILCADGDKPIPLKPSRKVSPGSKIR